MTRYRTTVRAALAILAATVPPAVLAQSTQAQTSSSPSPSLEARLQQVEDELAIRRILVDYSATQDARDYAGYAALFAREGEWVNGKIVHKGPAAIHKMLVDLYGDPPPGFVNNESYHITSNPQVDVHGDRATARSRHLLIMRGPNGEPQPALAGRYEDEFIREDGQWKILRRVDYPIMPTPQEWMEQIRARQAK